MGLVVRQDLMPQMRHQMTSRHRLTRARSPPWYTGYTDQATMRWDRLRGFVVYAMFTDRHEAVVPRTAPQG